MKKFAKYAICFCVGVLFALGFISLTFHAIAREDEFREAIRKERCEKHNNFVGQPLESYCAG